MFGDSTQQDMGGAPMQPLDPSVMGDPSGAPVQEHQATPAYPADDQQAVPAPNPVQQMHNDAVAASATPPTVDTDTPTQDAPTVGSVQAVPAQGDEELLAVKQQALDALSPLVGNLDQSPEEKFRTTMMMIQASDDRSLVRTAYEAAQAIEDEKVKAQALLDVINEINYFTSQAN